MNDNHAAMDDMAEYAHAGLCTSTCEWACTQGRRCCDKVPTEAASACTELGANQPGHARMGPFHRWGRFVVENRSALVCGVVALIALASALALTK